MGGGQLLPHLVVGQADAHVAMKTLLGRTNSSMPARPPSRPNPLDFTPPNGAVGVIAGEAVDVDGARLELGGEAVRPAEVAGVEVGAEAEVAVVGLGQGVVVVARTAGRRGPDRRPRCWASVDAWSTSPKTVGCT